MVTVPADDERSGRLMNMDLRRITEDGGRQRRRRRRTSHGDFLDDRSLHAGFLLLLGNSLKCVSSKQQPVRKRRPSRSAAGEPSQHSQPTSGSLFSSNWSLFQPFHSGLMPFKIDLLPTHSRQRFVLSTSVQTTIT